MFFSKTIRNSLIFFLLYIYGPSPVSICYFLSALTLKDIRGDCFVLIHTLLICCLFLLAFSIIFIVIELRARFDRIFLAYGLSTLLIAIFCLIDVAFQPVSMTIPLTKIQHCIGSFFPACILWQVLLLCNIKHPVLIKLATGMGMVSLMLFLSTTMFTRAGTEIIGTRLYMLTFAPFMLVSIFGIITLMFMTFFKSSGNRKIEIGWHLFALTTLSAGGMVDIVFLILGRRFVTGISNHSVYGFLLYGSIVTVLFISRISQLLKDREIAFSKLRVAYYELDSLRPLARLGQEVATVNHEVKNKTFSIAMTLAALQRLPLPRETAEKVERCASTALEVSNYCRSALDQSKSSSAGKEFIDLASCIKNAAATFSDSGDRLFSIQAPFPDLMVLAERKMLQSSLENLFSNSIQASASRIAVRVYVRQTVVLIVIEDNGTGCDPLALASLFTPFFSTKKDQHGSGLGMSIVQNVLQNHGGTISAYSKNVAENCGTGMIFAITLPLSGDLIAETNDAGKIIIIEKGLEEHTGMLEKIYRNIHQRAISIPSVSIARHRCDTDDRVICSPAVSGRNGIQNCIIIEPESEGRFMYLLDKGNSKRVVFTEETALNSVSAGADGPSLAGRNSV